jgi:hypothetical protein
VSRIEIIYVLTVALKKNNNVLPEKVSFGRVSLMKSEETTVL